MNINSAVSNKGYFGKMVRIFLLNFLAFMLLWAPLLSVSAAIGGASSNGIVGSSPNGIGGYSPNAGNSANGLVNPIGGNGSLNNLVSNILNVILVLGTIVVILAYLYAGFSYVMARGDEKAITSAHQMLLWTTVGAAIIFGAKVIQTVLINTASQLSS